MHSWEDDGGSSKLLGAICYAHIVQPFSVFPLQCCTLILEVKHSQPITHRTSLLFDALWLQVCSEKGHPATKRPSINRWYLQMAWTFSVGEAEVICQMFPWDLLSRITPGSWATPSSACAPKELTSRCLLVFLQCFFTFSIF